MAEFDYKQRPFSRKLTDAEYDAAVGILPADCKNSCGCYINNERAANCPHGKAAE